MADDRTDECARPHGSGGGALKRSLFFPGVSKRVNGQKQNVAVHLYGGGTVNWWHRNLASGLQHRPARLAARAHLSRLHLRNRRQGRRWADRGPGDKGDHLQNPTLSANATCWTFSKRTALGSGGASRAVQIAMTGETMRPGVHGGHSGETTGAFCEGTQDGSCR